MSTFKVGDEVQVLPAGPDGVWHRAHGMSYKNECQPGSTGVVTAIHQDNRREEVTVRWQSHPNDNRSGNSSTIESACLEPLGPTPEELAEVYRSLGVVEP